MAPSFDVHVLEYMHVLNSLNSKAAPDSDLHKRKVMRTYAYAYKCTHTVAPSCKEESSCSEQYYPSRTYVIWLKQVTDHN